MQLEKLTNEIENSNLLLKQEALTYLKKGLSIESDYEPPEHYLEAYLSRHEHLSSFNSDYAICIRRCIEELIKNLEANNENLVACLITNKDKTGFHFIIYFNDADKVLGCIKVASQKDLDEQVWKKLWES
jgi:hypothetical protein